jgi:hypothetical protein
MMSQIYSGMVKEYRSPEMGEAIFPIYRFYADACKKSIFSRKKA